MVQGLTEAERLLDCINNLNDTDELTPEELAELAETSRSKSTARNTAGDLRGPG